MEKAVQAAAGALSDKVILRPAGLSYRRQLAVYGQSPPQKGKLVDEPYRCFDATIQTGPESLDFPRRHVNPTVHYVGALLLYRAPGAAGTSGEAEQWPQTYKSTLVITQGTIDNLDQNKLIVPLVVSRINEGKSDVNARVEHAGVGVSLRTEAPKPGDIAKAVETVLTDPGWKQRAEKMRRQFDSQDPAQAAAAAIESVGPPAAG